MHISPLTLAQSQSGHDIYLANAISIDVHTHKHAQQVPLARLCNDGGKVCGLSNVGLFWAVCAGKKGGKKHYKGVRRYIQTHNIHKHFFSKGMLTVHLSIKSN